MTDDQQNNEDIRFTPANDLDFNMQMTEPEWGREKGKALAELSTVRFLNEDNEGKVFVDETNKNEVNKAFTKDLRLGNLGSQELNCVRYDLVLGQDIAIEGFSKSWLALRSRVAATMETSQSKGGFLRNLMNTIKHETKNQTIEPPKKSFFGKQQEQGGF